MLSGSSTVEEHSPCHPKVAGLSPVTTTDNERERNGVEKFVESKLFFSFQVVCQLHQSSDQPDSTDNNPWWQSCKSVFFVCSCCHFSMLTRLKFLEM
jgi:hypothetical protein